MDRNEVLSATRAEFLAAFADVARDMPQQSLDRLFELADKSPSPNEQRRYFDAHSAFKTRVPMFVQFARQGLEKLVNRSFQTAYNNFRPSFQGGQSTKGLSLVDTNAFENELRVDEITQRLRNLADEQLRDLNIRVAILFDQDNIKERENPFRPYLLSKALLGAIKELELPDEMTETLIGRLSQDFLAEVALIYDRVNALMAARGIAAELQLKIHNPMAQPVEQAVVDEPEAELETEAEGDVEDEVAATSAGWQNGATADGRTPAAQPVQGGHARWGASAHGGHGQPTTGQRAAFAPSARGSHAIGQPVGAREATMAVDRLIETVQQRRPMANPMVASQSFETDPPASEYLPQTAGQPIPASTAADAEAAAPRHAWLAPGEAMGGALRNFLSSGPAGGVVARAASALTSSVRGLLKSNTPSAEQMMGEQGDVRNLIMELRPGLSGMASDTTEQMTIDIVAMLFEFILRDEHVPAEIRAQLGRLQFLVLRIALQDPALFTQRHHPARLLVNRIGSIAMGLGSASGRDEQVTNKIRYIIQTLLADEHERVELFTQMLDELDAFVARELRVADDKIDRAVRVMETAESRTLAFARITASISESLSGLTLDPYLQSFLINDWAHVIERAGHRADGSAERFRKMIPDLVWSIAPKTQKGDREQLLALIPALLGTLREGLALAGWTAEQQKELHGWLIDAHTHAMRAWNAPAVVPDLATMRQRLAVEPPVDLEVAGPQVRAAALDKRVLESAIKEIEVELDMLDRLLDGDLEAELEAELDVAPADTTGDAPAAEEHSPVGVLERLRTGITIEINLDGKPTLALLNWVSPTATNLVLTVEGQTKPAVISVRLFQRFMATGRARFVETAPLFERAVASLLASADQLDRKGDQPVARVLH